MAVIIENGTIVTDANSYVTEIQLTAYAAERGITLVGDTEELIHKSMDYLETLDYVGYRLTRNQSLKWPRSNVWFDGYPLNPTLIPDRLQRGQMECCIAIDEGNNPLNDALPQIRREKVDVLEVEYAVGSATITINRRVLAILRPLLGSMGGWQVKVSKA